MAYDERVAERIRKVLSGRSDVVERKMMGGICFMIDGGMCCGVSGTSVIARVGRAAYQEALARPHVRPMDLGGRRPTGFVLVDPPGYRTGAALTAWVRRGIDVVAALSAGAATAGPGRRTRSRHRPAARS